MYAYLNGKVAEKGPNSLVIDVNGVGYLLSVSMNTLQETPPIGENMKVYTLLSVREDAMELFGFASQEEKKMFSRLLAVSGIGPKVALSILGAMPLRDLTLAIVTGDITSLSRAPGVGKKTAQRIALELKEKVDESDLKEAINCAQHIGDNYLQEQAQGYSQPESFTHGTSDQRMRWLKRGYLTGDMSTTTFTGNYSDL